MPVTLKPDLKIGITGKQNILSEEKDLVYIKIKEKIKAVLKKHKTASFVGYSAMAKGADTIFAEVVTKEFKQPLKIIMPFEKDEYRKNFTNKEDLRVFDSWISIAGVEDVINKDEMKDEDAKNKAYQETGKFLADNCDEMIVVWDKQKPSGPGSTADILGIIASNGYQDDSVMPTNELNIIQISPINHEPINSEISRLKEEADNRAKQLKKQYTIAWRSTVILGWLTAVLFSINTAFGDRSQLLSELFSIIEFVLAISVFGIVMISRKRKYHFNFISQRLKAEKLRLINVFYNAGFKINLNELKRHNDPELMALIERANDKVEKSEFNSTPFSFYCVKKLVDEQLKYHRSMLDSRIARKPHQYEIMRKVTISLFLLNYFISFLDAVNGHQLLYHWQHSTVTFLAIFFPACFGLIETWSYFSGWDLLKSYSKSLKEELENTQITLKKVRYDREKLKDTFQKISIEMLTENKNWDAIIRGRPEEVKLF